MGLCSRFVNHDNLKRGVPMRIIDAEPQLVSDILDEMEEVDSHKREAMTVYIGHHRTLGRMVVIKTEDGSGVVVEMD
jgi:hypothetical protein